jgi:hypothetical protein
MALTGDSWTVITTVTTTSTRTAVIYRLFSASGTTTASPSGAASPTFPPVAPGAGIHFDHTF